MTLVTMVTTHINVNLFCTYFHYKYKMKNSQYQMLHMSIIQNNFLNKNLSTLCVHIFVHFEEYTIYSYVVVY